MKQDNRSRFRLFGGVFALFLALWLMPACGDDAEVPAKNDAGGLVDGGVGPCAGLSEGEVCDDDDPCTGATTCKAGECAGTSICECKSDSECAVKDDGDLCNGGLFCDLNTNDCKVNPATVVTCDGKNDGPCSANTCLPATGKCSLAVAADGGSCDDGVACTSDTVCKGGVCGGGKQDCACQIDADCGELDGADKLCSGVHYCDVSQLPWTCKLNAGSVVQCSAAKDSECLKNTCDSSTGKCAPAAVKAGTACEFDGVACTTDGCDAGSCRQGEIGAGCTCAADKDCVALDDGDACNGVLFCNLAHKTCQADPSSIVHCASVDDGPCAQAACDPKSGDCALKQLADGSACADGNSCTSGESCKAGICTAADDSKCQCKGSEDCKSFDDGDPCTGVLYCDQASGKCKVNPASVPVCNEDMGTPCLKSSCDSKTGNCKPVAANEGVPCEADDTWCTSVDLCKGGVCSQADNGCNCLGDSDCAAHDDGNACNGSLYCDKATHFCAVNPATVVQCKPADGACQAAVCDAKTGKCGAAALPDGTPCDEDGFKCSQDACSGGKCSVGENTCKCWTNADCAPFDNGVLCDGTLFCDKDAGPPVCKVNPATIVKCPAWSQDACIGTSCDLVSGKCAPHAIREGLACDDGEGCTVDEACAKGDCIGLPAPATKCDDGKVCTADACVLGKGCVNLPTDGTPCDDDDACTAVDYCVAGKCTAGKPVDCSGKTDACNTASCDPQSGQCVVSAKANLTPCDADGSGCTVKDACLAGKCVAGAAMDCSAKSTACAVGQCSSTGVSTGACVATPKAKTVACNDGDICTSGDFCNGEGVCAGKAVDCDDGSQCTSDVCLQAKGCTHGNLLGNTLCTGGVCGDQGKCVRFGAGGRLAIAHDAGLALDAADAVWAWGAAYKKGVVNPPKGTFPYDPFKQTAVTGKATLAAMGSKLACAVSPDGGIYCWGPGVGGAIKKLPGSTKVAWLQGAMSDRMCAVNLSGDLFCFSSASFKAVKEQSDMLHVAPGLDHTCAVTKTRTVRCWGGGHAGQLGGGAKVPATLAPDAAVTASGLTDVAEVCSGDRFSCARSDKNGQVRCWGMGGSGQLGAGNSDDAATPALVTGLSGAKGIACGRAGACALTSANTVVCWGDNDFGQLGDGSTASKSQPTAVKSLASIDELVGLDRTFCARSSVDGKISCWGKEDGALLRFKRQVAGDPWYPTAPKAAGIVDMRTGPGNACGIDANGGSSCWGANHNNLLLQNKADTFLASPALMTALAGAKDFAFGAKHACLINGDMGIQCWGDNAFGQSSDNPEDGPQINSPAWIGVDAPNKEIHLGHEHGCSLASSGQVWCWGAGSHGQMGWGSKNAKNGPGYIENPASSFKALSVGVDTACAISTAGPTYCWGRNEFGQAGTDTAGADVLAPVALTTALKFTAVDVGGDHSCALENGNVWCWGGIGAGGVDQNLLGDGAGKASVVPVKVLKLSGITALTVAQDHNCAIKGDKSVWCWGSNGAAALGQQHNGLVASQPAVVLNLAGIDKIWAGAGFNCARNGATSKTLCWGSHGRTPLGTDVQFAHAPVQVAIVK